MLASETRRTVPPLPEASSLVRFHASAAADPIRRHALTGLSPLTGRGSGVIKRTALAHLMVALVPALAIAACGRTYRWVTAPTS